MFVFFNYPHIPLSQEESMISVIKDVGRRRAFIMQKDLVDFESNLATYVGAKVCCRCGQRYRWVADVANGRSYQIER